MRTCIFEMSRRILPFYGETRGDDAHSLLLVAKALFSIMGYSVDSGSSSVEPLNVQDPNIPSHVPHFECNETWGGQSVCSEMSDETMRQHGLKYSGTPDIGEIANMTLHVNYGDLANMACATRSSFRSLVLDPVLSTEGDAHVTWSQLLDSEALPSIVRKHRDSKSRLWTKSHNEPPSVWDVPESPPPFHTAMQQLAQRRIKSSDSGCSGGFFNFRRRRVLTAIKTLLSDRRKAATDFDQKFASVQAETEESVTLCVGSLSSRP